jgi:hypothetical protein
MFLLQTMILMIWIFQMDAERDHGAGYFPDLRLFLSEILFRSTVMILASPHSMYRSWI